MENVQAQSLKEIAAACYFRNDENWAAIRRSLPTSHRVLLPFQAVGSLQFYVFTYKSTQVDGQGKSVNASQWSRKVRKRTIGQLETINDDECYNTYRRDAGFCRYREEKKTGTFQAKDDVQSNRTLERTPCPDICVSPLLFSSSFLSSLNHNHSTPPFCITANFPLSLHLYLHLLKY